MRFKRFKLERYGHFDGDLLRFSGNCDLHIIFGPNEAGKSTALSAINDALFGIPNTSLYNFRHDYARMRLQAAISSQRLSDLTFYRRKGARNTLLGPDEQPLPDDKLTAYLGGLDRKRFCQMFGLNQADLRAGGKALLSAEGDAAESIFGAASGLQSALAISRHFNNQANGLFTQRRVASKPFYQATDQRNAARDALREASVKPEEWADLERDQAALDKRQAELKAERLKLGTALRSAERNLLVRPKLQELQSLQARIAEIGDPVTIDKDAREAGHQTHERREKAKTQITQLNGEILFDQAQLADLKVDEKILSLRLEIERLNESRIKLGEAQDRQRHLIMARKEQDRRQTSLIAQLGLEPNADGAHLKLPPKIALQTLNPLITKHAILEERQKGLQESIKTAQKKLEDAKAHLSTTPAMPDTDALVRTKLPLVEAIDEFERDIDAQQQTLQNARARRKDLTSEIARLDQEIEQLNAEGALPTAEIIEQARSVRDRDWTLMRHHFIEQSGDPACDELAELTSHFGDRPAATVFEEHLRDADKLADRRYDEAERLARLSQLQAQRCASANQYQERSEAVRQSEQDLAATKTRWQSLWRPSGIEPLGTREMRGWLQQAQDLRRQHQSIQETETRQAACKQDLEEWQTAWRDAMDKLGQRRHVPPTDAEALRNGYDELYNVIDTINDHDSEIVRIDGERKAFIAQAQTMQTKLGEDHKEQDIDQCDQWCADLAERLHRSLADQQRALDIRNRHQRLDQQRQIHINECERCAQSLDPLLARAGLVDGSALMALFERIDERERLQARCLELIKDIERLGDGLACDEIAKVADASSLERDEVAKADAGQALDDLERQMGACGEEKERLHQRRREIEQGRGAGQHARAEADSVDKLRDIAESYMLQRTASFLLNRAIETVRARRQGPILTVASDMFHKLTGGRYAGLGIDYDSKDRPVLVGKRSENSSITADGMSEGTRDQLFLALRLALVRDYNGRAEPLPFIGDDLLVSFDDERAAAVLTVLADLSQSTQVILFTHHAHMVELARNHLGEDGFVLHQLGADASQK